MSSARTGPAFKSFPHNDSRADSGIRHASGQLAPLASVRLRPRARNRRKPPIPRTNRTTPETRKPPDRWTTRKPSDTAAPDHLPDPRSRPPSTWAAGSDGSSWHCVSSSRARSRGGIRGAAATARKEAQAGSSAGGRRGGTGNQPQPVHVASVTQGEMPVVINSLGTVTLLANVTVKRS